MPPPAIDGRHLRSVSSRARILEATLALIQEGDPDPRAEDVALRAGVGLRTVFRLFSDKERVCAEMLVPQRQEFVDCFTAAFSAQPGPGRVRELFTRLSRLYEARAPLRRAAIIRRYTSPSLAAAMAELDAAITAFIDANMPTALPERAYRCAMLNLCMSFDSWLQLRDSQALPQEQTLAALRQAMEPHLA